MRITEDEKKEILSKYGEDTSDELLQHMKRNFPVYEFNIEFMNEPLKQIYIDEKLYHLQRNKKYLVDKLSSVLESEWVHLGYPKIRRTIKKYIDGFK